jgi:two-component system CheB/CheR fusion protein
VNGDRDRLAQALGNLLHNAAKFTPEGGRVDVTIAAESTNVVVCVRDTGIGIPESMLDRVFAPFSQAEQALDQRAGGLGLGLALVKGIVELHGGSVRAESAGRGRGARFTIRLPVLEAPPVEEASSRAEPAPQSSRRVLVIEDNVDAADSLKELLELEAHEVTIAYDGPAGIAMAAEVKPEVVLCDIGLPGMSGYEVARALRDSHVAEGAVLVALTGYARREDRDAALEAGFDDHLAKPPDPKALQRLLAEAPPRRAA